MVILFSAKIQMDWTKETISSFISFIRERPAIWDTQSPYHRMKNKRNDALQEVAMLMGISIKEVIAKWTILRNQYSREKRKMMGTGSGTDSGYTTKWYAYKDMEDLMSSSTPIVYIKNSEEIDSSINRTPPQCTPTTPPQLKKKRERDDDQNIICKEVVETLRVMRERKNSPHNPTDDLTCFGLYIAAHLGKYSPHLQCKAKYEINNILYKLDMESLGPYSPPVTSVSSVDDHDSNSAFCPIFITADDQKINIDHSITQS
ncbi:uncharacterized protein LOC128675528 isoform X2 [Plodia interpunctella]|uniref:uncharacterized protein LOC128675528 isoform X2 n=1 Tax=Plodia interpunctella TaxID=58824 RepID=UPI00236743FD|nr:uncharacterized protein LOC128675528 isoform X2 [Plodia interpunctella]